jgi:hypothetical protein
MGHGFVKAWEARKLDRLLGQVRAWKGPCRWEGVRVKQMSKN